MIKVQLALEGLSRGASTVSKSGGPFLSYGTVAIRK